MAGVGDGGQRRAGGRGDGAVGVPVQTIAAAGLLALLPGMPPAELRKLRATADALLAQQRDRSRLVPQPCQSLYGAVVQALRDERAVAVRGLPAGEGTDPVARAPGYDVDLLRTAAEACAALYQDHLRPHYGYRAVHAFHGAVAKAAVAYLRDVPAPTKPEGALFAALSRALHDGSPATVEQAARELVDQHYRRQPLSVPSLLRTLADPVAVLEHSYPGYLAVGMLRVLVQPYRRRPEVVDG